MPDACPLQTPAERQYQKMVREIEAAMMQKIYNALKEATEQALAITSPNMSPPSEGYFTASMLQKIYCLLCKADPDTFTGGRADIAIATIRNCKNIARHYWGADV